MLNTVSLYQTNYPPPPPSRGPGKWTPACETDDPPPWCEDLAPGTNIDNHLIIGFIMGILIIIRTLKIKLSWKTQ